MKHLALLIAIMSAGSLAGCHKNEPASPITPDTPILTIPTYSYNISPIPNNQTQLCFTVNTDWEISIEYEENNSGWLSATPMKGQAGDIEVSIIGAAYFRDVDRKAFIEIQYGDQKQRLSITQNGLNETTRITSAFDPYFAAELQRRKYISDAKHIQAKDVKNITKLYISDAATKLTSLKGIEYFHELQTLLCANNQIETLDISKNFRLAILECGSNQLTEIDTSQNTELTALYCENNKLSSLDISNNIELADLSCSFNPLKCLDISNNIKLTGLVCADNGLVSLDISHNPDLSFLGCPLNQLTSLNVSNNLALSSLLCYNNKLPSLDLTHNSQLITPNCSDNLLTSINISNSLQVVSCHNNLLTSLNIGHCTELQTINCENNQLSTLDITQNQYLTGLYCSHNQLHDIDTSQNSYLHILFCDNNYLEKLDTTKNYGLNELDCSHNHLTESDLTWNGKLEHFSCHNNPGNDGVFQVKAWFNNDNIPIENENGPCFFTSGYWEYNGETIRIQYKDVWYN